MHSDSEAPGPSNAPKPEARTADAVLNEVLVNQSALKQATSGGQHTEDEDLVLAKMLQEQERAFLALAGSSGPGLGPAENLPPAPLGPRASHSPEEGRPVSDEELAWRLMQEEQAQFQQRMMALAGLGNLPGEEGAEDDDDEDDGMDPDDLSYEELTALGEVVGTVATGLSAAQLAALPRSTYDAARSASSSSPLKPGQDEEQCAVCRVEFEGQDEVVSLPCHHFYHPECISQWLQQKKVCPQCNTEVGGGGGGDDTR